MTAAAEAFNVKLMRQPLAVPVVLAILSVVTACPDYDHDSRLEDALEQYVDQREAEVDAGCKCYQLFLNPSSVDHDMFSSEQECRETLWPAAKEDAVDCMKAVLDSSAYTTQASVDVVKCYTEAIARQADCHAQNAEECSQTACSSDTVNSDKCRGKLTTEEAEALYYCATRVSPRGSATS